jgi:RimJ/RimL family protein N-acetyltransferase
MSGADTERSRVIFTTERLVVRLAVPDDVDLYLRLWTDPRVMTNVGFPQGLRIARETILERISKSTESEFDRLLVIEISSTRQAIGECKLGQPNAEGVATTDVKLLPDFWGHRYGVEVKRGLLNHLFTHTSCRSVEATPNVNNAASIKMQEAVGGARLGETTHVFPPSMQSYTKPVRYFIYSVSRATWESLAGKSGS